MIENENERERKERVRKGAGVGGRVKSDCMRPSMSGPAELLGTTSRIIRAELCTLVPYPFITLVDLCPLPARGHPTDHRAAWW